MPRIGYTSRLNTVNAAIGRVQLRRLDQWNQARRRMASLYREGLKDAKELRIPPGDTPEEKPVYHLFVVKSSRRDRLMDELAKARIETGIHYPIPIHLQTPYKNTWGYTEGSFPESERLAREVLSLPLYAGLTDEEVKYVCERVKEALDK